jgi:hypothetical protein
MPLMGWAQKSGQGRLGGAGLEDQRRQKAKNTLHGVANFVINFTVAAIPLDAALVLHGGAS